MEEVFDLAKKALEERKEGHWIGRKLINGEWKEYTVKLKDGYVNDECWCSECKKTLTGSDEYECRGNYCPNCGTIMGD